MKVASVRFSHEAAGTPARANAFNKKTALISLFSLLSLAAFAKEQTITLDVPTMNCATCPFTVKSSLQKVDGVKRAEVSYDTRSAVVTFNDEKTTAKALTDATTNAGYPSTVKQ